VVVKDEKTSTEVWSIYNGGMERDVLGGWEDRYCVLIQSYL
jgi:hypothetical protein